jgi:hypothetical protein
MNTLVDICGEVLWEATEVSEAKERLREEPKQTRESPEQSESNLAGI